jgi:peptide deformylase
MAVLKRSQFGNPVLRQVAEHVPKSDIATVPIQELIQNMRDTLLTMKLGVGLAAPQVGEGKAIVVIAVRPLPHRPHVAAFDLTLVNPEITDYLGSKKPLYEGCISAGPGRASIFARVPRHDRVKVKYQDDQGKTHHEIFEGFKAHVVQHEVDHLNGILFVDKVKDTKSYVTYAEYMKLVRKKLKEISG